MTEVPQYLPSINPLSELWLFSCTEPSARTFEKRLSHLLFLYENPWRKIMRNAFPILKAINILLVTDQREIRNNLFSVLSFDPITHLFPRSAKWVEVRLQKDHGKDCTLKTRLIMWHIFLFRKGHTERRQSLESKTMGADVWWPEFKS